MGREQRVHPAGIGIVEVVNYKLIDDNSRKVVLFHFPILFWDLQHAGSYHLYGHLHACVQEKFTQGAGQLIEASWYPEYRAANVGTMLNNFTPVTLDELCEKHGFGKISDEEFAKRELLTKRFQLME